MHESSYWSAYLLIIIGLYNFKTSERSASSTSHWSKVTVMRSSEFLFRERIGYCRLHLFLVPILAQTGFTLAFSIARHSKSD